MDERDGRHEAFVPEAELKIGPGVDYWDQRRDRNTAAKTNVDVWRARRDLADSMISAAQRIDAKEKR